VLAVCASALVALMLLPGHGFTAANGYSDLTSAASLRAAIGSVLYLVLIALLGVGVTALLRDSAAAVGTVLGLLYLFPILAMVISNPDWHRHALQIAPMQAGLDVQGTIELAVQPLSPWQGLGVAALWAFGALGVGGLTMRMRDA
jgi:ABC-2 type transport system permease protein